MTEATYFMDFNDVLSPKTDLIPSGTFVKVKLSITKGGFGSDGFLSQAKTTGTLYLNTILTVCEGIFVRRKIFYKFGIQSTDPQDKWVQKSLRQLRSVLESARHILPTDMSEDAKEKRTIKSLQDFEGLEFLIKVGVELSQNPQYKSSNSLQAVVTPDWPEYPKEFASSEANWPF
ncbi:hypothetical protein AGMMS49949_03080 [Alphaproteobacteria bacterium]|nr:hypothetical protein AGMMS49949_03080 [Alphaproteobacteria bacterium]GHS97953.1 hypothetical protein AGMMS50296_5310 [Alphaproteobacteria bacterium]